MNLRDRVYTIVYDYFFDDVGVLLNIENKEKTIVTRKFVERNYLERIKGRETHADIFRMHPNYFKKCITIAIKECGFEEHAGGARGNKVFRRKT